LAAAGLLEGRRATTHWYFCQRLAAAYPGVKVDAEPIFIGDGNIHTSAGVTAGMDLALALVEEDFGADVALRIARALVLFLRRPGGQSQFSVALNLKPTPRSLLGDLHLWIIDHLNESLTVETLATHVAMSPRNFSRIFAQEYRITPAKFVEQLRLETARRRLEESSDGVKRIAKETGFGSSESMRRVFLRHLRVSPTDYRSRFQGHFFHLNKTVKEIRKN
jgi:transcriptional regulator GlxA family with amidase domain